MEAHLSNLIPSLNSWRRNEFESGLGLWFRVLIGLARKTMQKIYLSIHRQSQKTWLFTNDFKHRHIINRWKSFFSTSMNSRSLPQNEALFGSDSLAKFATFVQKSMSMIWALSSRTEGTILTKRPCWAWWHQRSPSKWPKKAISLPWRNDRFTCFRLGPSLDSCHRGATPRHFNPLQAALAGMCSLKVVVSRSFDESKERENGGRRERETTKERERETREADLALINGGGELSFADDGEEGPSDWLRKERGEEERSFSQPHGELQLREFYFIFIFFC